MMPCHIVFWRAAAADMLLSAPDIIEFAAYVTLVTPLSLRRRRLITYAVRLPHVAADLITVTRSRRAGFAASLCATLFPPASGAYAAFLSSCISAPRRWFLLKAPMLIPP